jgi:tetratricopeptide (TPR) repeat protein
MWTAIQIIPTAIPRLLTYENVMVATEVLANQCLQLHLEMIHLGLRSVSDAGEEQRVMQPRELFDWSHRDWAGLKLSGTTLTDGFRPLAIGCHALSAAAALLAIFDDRAAALLSSDEVAEARDWDLYWRWECQPDDPAVSKIVQGYLALVIADLSRGLICCEQPQGDHLLVHPAEFLSHYMAICPGIMSPQQTVEKILAAEILDRPWRQEVDQFLATGAACKAKNDYEGAIAAYHQAIDRSPQYSYFHLELGRIYHDAKRYEEAAAAYQTAIDLDDAKAHYHANLGLAWYKLQSDDAAIAAFERAIAIKPEYGTPYGGLGDVYQRQERYPEAIAAYQQAIKFDPCELYYRNLGHVYFALAQYERAIEAYSRAITIAPQVQWSYAWRGDAHERLRQYEAALADYQQAIGLNPTYDWVVESYVRVQGLMVKS